MYFRVMNMIYYYGLGLMLAACCLPAWSAPRVAPAPPVTVTLESMFLFVTEKGGNSTEWNRLMQVAFSLDAKKPLAFCEQKELQQQSLEAEDSKGRKWGAIAFGVERHGEKGTKGATNVSMTGMFPEWASSGTEWIRLHGQFRVAVGKLHESPVYELALVKGAEQEVPIPGREISGDEEDVMTSDSKPCQLRLGSVRRDEDGMVFFNLALSAAEGTLFHLEGVELVDEQGSPIKSIDFGPPRFDSTRCLWNQFHGIEKAANMNKLRFKIKCWSDVEVITVPVDMKVGLGGPVPQDGGGKQR